MNTMQYIFISSVCLSIFYAFYKLIFRNEANFKQLRFYLLASIILSFLLPLTSFKIHVNLSKNQYADKTEYVAKSIKGDRESVTSGSVNNDFPDKKNKVISNQSIITWLDLLKKFYFIVLFVLLIRFAGQIITPIILYFKSKRAKLGNYIIIYNTRFKNTFSFFRWIFINTEFSSKEDIDQIISHEKIHASQYHSIDLIIIELLAAVMWFNPLVWMMRNTVQLVHEYLADEGAISTGINKLKYQALLINQVTEERLICLSSSFNHSLIKKRMIMMTKSKFNHRTKLKILALVPIAAVILLGVACVNGQNKTNVVTAVAPIRMNVLYLGLDNPIKIAASGYESSELIASIDNGTITGSNGEYIIRPRRPGNAIVTVSSKGTEIQKTEFRVKIVPDPVAKISGKNSGSITKSELLSAKGISVEMGSFDFDLEFKVVSFVLSATVPNSYTVREEISKSDMFSDIQIDLINSLVINQKLMVEEIKAIGPDGSIRKLSPMVFTINGE